MSLLDFLPEPIRKLFPSLSRKENKQKLQEELNRLQDELKNAQQTGSEGEVPAEDKPGRTAEISASIENIKGMLADDSVPWSGRVLKIALYAAPIVLSYFLALYLRDRGGLQMEHQEVIHPIGFYQFDESGDQARLSLTEEYTQRFWDNFPRYYFTPSTIRQPDTNTFFFDKSDAYITTKIILKNLSSSFPKMISTLHVEVTKTEAPGFPWDKLNTTPELERFETEDEAAFTNVGAAPAIDPMVTYHLTRSFSEEEDFGPLYAGDTLFVDKVPMLEDYELADVDYANNRLDEPFYMFHESGTPKAAGQAFQNIGGNEFRVISTPKELAEVTEVIATNSIKTVLDYYSVKQEKFTQEWELKLDTTLYFYDYSQDLLSYEEALYYNSYVPEEMYRPVIEENVSNSLDKAMEALYTNLGNAPEFHPEGVSLIQEKMEINLSGMSLNDSRSVFINTDQILNPDGYVIIYLKMRKPSHGTYRVNVNANAEFVSEVFIETLIPEETEFVYPGSLRFFEAATSDSTQVNR